MKYCSKCGFSMDDGFEWCPKCGTRVEPKMNEESRKVLFEGKAHKCPYCGEFLPSFATACPNCHNEIRGLSGVKSVSSLFEILQNARTEEEKTQMIRLFPVPNTMEDIIEFMILASANFDEENYVQQKEKGLSAAWLSKIEQCRKKAILASGSEEKRKHISELYSEIVNRVTKAQKKTRVPVFRRVAIAQFAVAVLVLMLIATEGSSFGANIRLLLAGLLMLGSGTLTLVCSNTDTILLWCIASYGVNIFYNFIGLFFAPGHIVFLLMYIIILAWLLFEKKGKDQVAFT